MLVKNKEWYKSKTVWSSGVAFILAIVTAMGVDPQVISLLIAIASALGLYGRVTATTSIKR